MVELRPPRGDSRPYGSCRRRSARWLGLPVGEEGGESVPGGLLASLLAWGIQFVLFLPGAVAGGALGWFLIRPVNWALGKFFRGFNWVFDRATEVYGRLVGWALRFECDRAPGLRRPDRPDGLRLHPHPRGVHPQPGQGPSDRERSVARLGRDGAHGRSDGEGR